MCRDARRAAAPLARPVHSGPSVTTPRWFRPYLVVSGGLLALLVGAVGTGAYVQSRALARVDAWLSGRRLTSTPALRARDELIAVGDSVDPRALETTLASMGYVARDGSQPGSYRVDGSDVVVHSTPTPTCEERALRISTRDGRVISITGFDGRQTDRAHLRGIVVEQMASTDRVVRKPVALDAFGEHIPAAVIAAEDRRFYEHEGIDLRAIARAAWADVAAGELVQGGSTITQQLAKNLFLEPERSFVRKAREAVLAHALEARLDKDDILEAYLNVIYLGRAGNEEIVGVERAAQVYFGKAAACLSPAEAAVIAGMIRAPNELSVLRHPEAALARARQVRTQLGADWPLDDLDLGGQDTATTDGLGLAPYFADFVESHLDPERATRQVITTIDPALQRSAADALRAGIERVRTEHGVDVEGAFVTIEASTGRILALVGGSDYADTPFNRAVYARRQIGSLVKPLIALAAFDEGIAHPRTMIEDAPVAIQVDRRTTWRPQNYDFSYRGYMSVRGALTHSVNLPFVALTRQLGTERVAAHLRSLGLEAEAHPSIALGAVDASPLEVAGAFAAIARGGRAVRPYAIETIVDVDGEIETHEPVRRSVASDQAAFLVFDTMRSVVNRGTAWRIRREGYDYDLAAKTGTSDDAHDLWLVAADHERVTVIWIGADQPRAIPTSSGHVTPAIFVAAMSGAPSIGAPSEYPPPLAVEQHQICGLTGARATPECPHVSTEYLPAGAKLFACPVHAPPPAFHADARPAPAAVSF